MSPTLLYIDSDAATRRLVTRVLNPGGVRVVEAATMSQAEQVADQTRPDIVIVDVDVAGLAVEDIVPVLRQGLDRPPIVLAVTADDRPQYVARMTEAGFAGVLSKPLDIDHLTTDIGRYLPTFPAQTEAPPVAAPATGETAVPPLWTRVLTPLTVTLVKSVATSEGVLVLRADPEADWVVIAGHSLRREVTLPNVGGRIPTAALKWLDPALAEGEPVVAHPTPQETAPLLPPECLTVLVAPVAAEGRVYGAVILGERRQRTFGFPPAQLAQCVAETRKIATVLRRFEQLDDAIVDRRREIDAMRVRAAWAVATGDHADPGREAIVRLGTRVGERLRLSDGQRIVLEHALRVHDVGRVWLERSVLSLGMLTGLDAHGLLDAHSGQTLEILTSLDCPPPVVAAVRMSMLPWKETGDDGLPGRVVAVVAAYESLTRGGSPDRNPLSPKDAIAEVWGESGRQFDPAVVSALADVVAETYFDGGVAS